MGESAEECWGAEVPLILGGHSFIEQLGNDPPASPHDQRRIVESCLNNGIVWFDTTYQPERVALGNVLHDLGRREEAKILAWNFFTDFAPGEPVGTSDYLRSSHIDCILEQLRTAYVDCLVLVPMDDHEANQRQEELATEWRRKGYVRFLGLWIADQATIERHPLGRPFQFAVRPFNVATEDAAPLFAACRECGWETLATSPFVRGWELDKLIALASAQGHGDAETLRPVVADLMLRYTLFHPDVSRVIVAMRRIEWVLHNRDSVARGPLTADEHRWLGRLRAGVAVARKTWWQRLRQLG
jgi:aryl-alcohol dehydrogenase-like predicted oxidoreductase